MKDWIFGIGALVGSALFGYYLGVYLSKKKARVNSKIKLSTDKVILVLAAFQIKSFKRIYDFH